MKLLYFARVRQMLGTGEETIDLPEDVATVHGVAEALRERGGAYEDVFGDTRLVKVAVNQAYVGWDAHVSAEDEVAFFPPVTGG